MGFWRTPSFTPPDWLIGETNALGDGKDNSYYKEGLVSICLVSVGLASGESSEDEKLLLRGNSASIYHSFVRAAVWVVGEGLCFS